MVSMVSPYMSKAFEESILSLKELVHSSMEKVHNIALLNEYELSDDEFQQEVIESLDSSLKVDFFNQFSLKASLWSGAREGVIRQYMSSRIQQISEQLKKKNPKQEFEVKRYFKVAVKCNSEGGDNVLEKDVAGWIEELGDLVMDNANKKFLKNTATKKQTVFNLYRMLQFPVSIKETSVHTHLSENTMEELINNHPDLYLPQSALKSGKDISDLLLVSANVVEFQTPSGKVLHRVEGRLKATNPQKWTKYVVGIRPVPHYDDAGAIEKVADTKLVYDTSKNINDYNKSAHIDHRYSFIPPKNQPITKDVHIKIRSAAENSIMQLLKGPYVDQNGLLIKEGLATLRSNLIYGDWVDLTMANSTNPMEVQVKGAFAYLLYGVNSPFGHNSVEYHTKRTEEWMKKVKVGNGTNSREYGVDKIADYVCNMIMIPAFSSHLLM